MTTHPWQRFYPPGALADLGAHGRHLPQLLADAALRFGPRTAVSAGEERWTFTRLAHEAHRYAQLFQCAGAGSGARVAIVLPNMPEYVAAMFGTWLVDATVAQVNPAYVAVEIGRILAHAGAGLVVTTADQLEKLAAAGIEPTVPVCLVGPGGPRLVSPARPVVDVSTWPDASPDVAVLQYTGGTTGLPKAVMLTHENILSNIEQRLRLTFRTLDLPEGASVVNTLPMCHVFGMTCVTLTGIATGMHQLIVPRFQTRAVLELIRVERPFAFFGVPTMYAAFLREPDLASFGLDRVTIFNSAGAPMPPAQLAQFEARVGAKVLDGFGISEASPSTHTNPPFLPRRPGSSGIPLPFTDVRIVEPGGGLVDVASGAEGELAIRGPQVMRGYWGDPGLTAATLRDGWLLTGDIARADADGYVYIVGRIKEIIVASGYNIYPAEIERVIARIDGVAEVSVFGIPDDYRGETVKAVVVPVPGVALDAGSVLAHCRGELAPFKVPTVLEFRDALPRTAVGKIDKRRLAHEHDTTTKE